MFVAEDGTVLSKQPVNKFVDPNTGEFIRPIRRPNESYQAWQKRIKKAMLASGLYPRMTYASNLNQRELLRITTERDKTKDHLTKLTELTTPNSEGEYDQNAYQASKSIPLVERKLNKLNNRLSKLQIKLGSEGKLKIPQGNNTKNGELNAEQVVERVKEINQKYDQPGGIQLESTGEVTNEGIPKYNVKDIPNNVKDIPQPPVGNNSVVAKKEESLSTSEKKRPQSFEQRLAEQLKVQGVTGPRQFGKRDKATLNALELTSSDLRIMGVSKFDESTFLKGIRTGRNIVTDQGTIIRTPNVRGPTQTLKILKKKKNQV
tara:strand:+ start:48 stop:1001 length:954 start_codon:yes stop_codon:yes gene_type:complete